jgi:hypothetical protein
MKHLARLMGISFFLYALAVQAAEKFPAEFIPPPVKRFVAAQNPDYGPPEPAIKKRLLAQKKNNKIHHFCVIGYKLQSGNAHVWVHWIEEKTLLLWRDGNSEESRVKGLTMAYRNLKLGRDTVATQNEIGGSNYLTTHAWWHAVADDCAAHGQKFTIKPFKK